MKFKDKLNQIIQKNNSLVCLGLDSDLERIPEHVKREKNPQFEFNKAIIEATHDLVCAYKPNIAFYEAEGLSGLSSLKLTIDYLRKKFPEIPIILDAKRADIGNTNKAYVKYIFDYLDTDAVTLHPYLGKESLKPFLERSQKGIFILCRTSNPGAGEFQDLLVSSLPKTTLNGILGLPKGSSEVKGSVKALYQIVAERVSHQWNYNGNCGLVVGATYPVELKIVRRIASNLPILIPGVGTQGGDLEKTVKFGIDSKGQNAIINSSRSIIFASSGEDFTQRARVKAVKLRGEVNKYR